LRAKIASIVVKLDISQLIVQTRKKTNMARRKIRRVYRKKYYKKEKNGQAYFVEWDYDASSDEDDDDKPSRGLAGVAIKEAPSLFSKPYCWQKVNQR
jgi:hypothetical protein